jgi:hypothetical protein
MSERHYDYSCHTEIPNHMRAYLMDVVDQEYLEAVDIEDINDFLNGLVDWDEDYEELPSYMTHIH